MRGDGIQDTLGKGFTRSRDAFFILIKKEADLVGIMGKILRVLVC